MTKLHELFHEQARHIDKTQGTPQYNERAQNKRSGRQAFRPVEVGVHNSLKPRRIPRAVHVDYGYRVFTPQEDFNYSVREVMAFLSDDGSLYCAQTGQNEVSARVIKRELVESGVTWVKVAHVRQAQKRLRSA